MTIKNDYIAAIDIGTTKIVAIVGRKDSQGKIKILGAGQAPSKGVRRGVVINIEETASAIQYAANQAKESSGIDFTDVFVGIAGQHIRSTKNRHSKYINTEDNEIQQSDVQELTSDMYKISLEAGEEIIHVIPQNYIVDNESGIRQPVGMFGKKLEANFHVVIGQVSSAKIIKKCLNRAGLNVIKLILEPIASAEAVLTEDEKEAGVALVDIGGGTTDLAVFYDSIIRHTAVVPFGGNVVTFDIKEGCSILHRQAEKLKMEFGSALGEMAPDNKVVSIPGISGREPKEISFKSLAYIIQARMEEIIDGIAYQIENSGYMNKLGAGIALTGGGAMLKNLPQLMKFRTGLDVRMGYPKRYISAEGNSTLNLPKYSTSVGLIIKGYDYIEQYKNTLKQSTDVKTTDEDKQKETKDKKGDGIISSLKETIHNLFDEKDTEM